MAGDSSDLLMTFVQLNGKPLPGEAATTVSSKDPLMDGFENGSFFEVQDFGFGLTLNDNEQTGSSLNQASTQRSGVAPTASVASAASTTKFAKWRSAKSADELDKLQYSSEMDPFEYTRLMDQASPILFQNCCNTISFRSVSLVKRKVAGWKPGGPKVLQAFLRFDFSDVLLISLDWNNDKGIKEKGKFIYRGLHVRYRTQRADGSLEERAQPAQWKQPPRPDAPSGQSGGS